jgi:SAM-dependent methyltransferase
MAATTMIEEKLTMDMAQVEQFAGRVVTDVAVALSGVMTSIGHKLGLYKAAAKDIPESEFDLICFMDCLHDMGDPVGALKKAKNAMNHDGTVLLVEPMAGDNVEDNINPVGRLYYAASTAVCTPCSCSQEVGLALGAQAGQRRLTEILNEAGFSEVNRVAETGFNLILEARI